VWSASLLPRMGSISFTAVICHRKYKYTAISQTDGSLSVWAYEGALDRKGPESPKTLFPLVVWMARLPLPTRQRLWGMMKATL
jgi:hypothetical protein